MTPKRKKTRVRWRKRGDAPRRAYGDFRDYDDVGGKREALIAPGETMATTDPVIADKLVADRLAELEERRRNRVYLGIQEPAAFKAFAIHHLKQKKASRKGYTERWLGEMKRRLREASEFFGPDRELTSIKVADVQAFVTDLSQRPGRSGKYLSNGTIRHYLNAISNLYVRAQSEGRVPPGYNPVQSMVDKPTIGSKEADFLEVDEAALFLEAARVIQLEHDAWWEANAAGEQQPWIPAARIDVPIYVMVAMYLLSGGRKREVAGLDISELSFDRRTITFRTNRHRRLKTRASHRTVPMHPQMAEILREYLSKEKDLRKSEEGGEGLIPIAGLLIRSGRTGGMIWDTRKALDIVARRAGLEEGRIRPHLFRHTYTAARLQTTDGGVPVSVYQVSRELGHASTRTTERIYAHLGEIRHRSEHVEFRVEQHAERLGDRLEQVRAG